MATNLLTNHATWEVLSKTGRAFFDALVEHLTNVCGVAVAFVVEATDATGGRVCPLASWGVDNFREGRCYDTIGTPCERLRRGAPGIYADRLAERFPADAWLQTTGMQSYVGLPLIDGAGRVLGHIGVLDDRPLEDPQSVAATIEPFVPRCRAELARARLDIALARLMGNHAWVLYRSVPPQFAANMIAPDGQGFLGFSEEELAAYDDLRCRQLYEDDREWVLAAFAEALETGRDFVVQYRLWEKNRKRLRRFQDYGHVERDRKGRPTLISGVLVDITARRGADNGHRRAERQILSRLGDLPGMVFRCGDPDWTMQFVGGAARPLTGYGADELQGDRAVSYSRLVHPDDRDRVFAKRREAIAGAGYRVEYRLIDAAGDEHVVAETGRRSAEGRDGSAAVEGFVVDLTEQRAAQRALQESEERFRAIGVAAQDAIIMVDPSGRIVFWNPSAERVFGYAEGEVTGQEVHTLLAPLSYRAKALRGLEQFSRTGKGPVFGQTLRLEAMRKDGGEFPIELSISSVHVHGRWHAIGIVRDVTEKERALTVARESEARFRALFDHAADGMLIADPPSGRFLAGNRRMAEMLGCSREELEGLSVADIHPQQDLAAEMARFRRFAAEGQGEAVDVRVLRRDGSVFEANVSGFTIRLGEHDCLVGAFRDVTEHKLAQRRIDEERQKLRLYLDNAPVITVVFDIDGTVQMVNRRACDLLGYPAEEIVGRNWVEDFIPEHHRERMARQFTRCFRERCCDCDTIEHPVQTRSGAQRLFAWHNEMIQNEAGQAVSVFCSGEDVTERRRIEQELQAAQERLEFVVRTVPAVLYACEPNETLDITFVGANLKDQFGIAPERAMGHSGLWLEHAHPSDVSMLLECHAELMVEGRSAREFRLRADGAGYVWAQFELRLILGDDGSPQKAVGYLLDVSQRKEAERALRESEASLAHAQAIASLGSWESDLVTGGERWSDEVFRILGYAPNAFVPSREAMLRRVHPDDRQLVTARLDKALSAEAGFDFDFRVRLSSGEERFVRARGEILRDDKGRSARILGTLLDFTERKRAELSLERSRQMLKELAGHLQSVREEERTTIAREIHDELGQQLTALKIDLVRLRSRLTRPDAVVGALLDSMLQGVSKTIEAVQQLMAQLRPSVLDTLGLIAAIEWQAEQFAERTGIDCAVTVPEQEFALTAEASTALFRILQESLTNVVRHAGASRVAVELDRDEGWVSLSVHDNGRGITDLERESSQSFGLLGMRERAEVFGGRVEFHGKRGKGTLVRVCIPAEAVKEKRTHA